MYHFEIIAGIWANDNINKMDNYIKTFIFYTKKVVWRQKAPFPPKTINNFLDGFHVLQWE